MPIYFKYEHKYTKCTFYYNRYNFILQIANARFQMVEYEIFLFDFKSLKSM